MKIFQLYIALLPILVLASCAQEEILTTIDLADDSSVSEMPRHGKEDALIAYIKQNHPNTESRTVSDVLDPIIYNGDTVMYVANFGDGWEIYSNSYTMPILLMKSDTGTFDCEIFDSNPTFGEFFEIAKESLYKEKNDEDAESQNGSEEWLAYSSQPVGSVSAYKAVPSATYLVGKCYTTTELDTIQHIIPTRWHQNSPYNAYAPYVNETTSHSLTGCVAVGIAQFLYYSHYVWNEPLYSVTNATYNSISNSYSFSGQSSEIWDDMTLGLTTPSSATAVALLIGNVGVNVSMSYGTDYINQGSSSKLSTYGKRYLESVTSNSYSYSSFDPDALYASLAAEKPVLGSLYDSTSGHVVIFDYCRRTQTATDYYYAYLSSELYSSPELAPTLSYDQAVALYGSIVTMRHSSSISRYFKVNWGWGPYASDPEVNESLLTITAGGYTFTDMYILTY